MKVSLHETVIRQSEKTGEYYLSSVRKFVSDNDKQAFTRILQNSVGVKEFSEQLALEIASNDEFASSLLAEIARKVELKLLWKKLSGKEIVEDSESEIDSEIAVNE